MKQQIITIIAALLFVAPAFANDHKSLTITPENTEIVSAQLTERPEYPTNLTRVDRPTESYEKGRSKLEQAHQPPREKDEDLILIVHDF